MSFKNFIMVLVATFFAAISLFSAEPKEINVQTNLHCGTCASKIEKKLKKTDGILETNADVDTKVVTIKFDPEKTNENDITKIISNLGYEAKVMYKKVENKKSTSKPANKKK